MFSNRTKNTTFAYANNHLAFNVGREEKDSYTIDVDYEHDIETDKIIYRAQVIKNWAYPSPSSKDKKDGMKYKEVIFSGTYKQCYEFIENIVKAKGHWIQDPNVMFGQIFIEPENN